MKIGIDARGIYKELDGIGRYGLNLIKEIANIDDKNEYIIYKNPEIEFPIVNKKNFIEKIIYIPRYTIKEQIFLPIILKKDKLDLFHSLHNVLPIFYKGNTILTIHDIMVAKFLWFYDAFNLIKKYVGLYYFKMFINLSIKKAKKIIVPSNYTKEDIIKYFNIKEEKIIVCYEGVDEIFYNEDNSKKQFNFPYILYLGNFKPYKNLKRLIEAYKSIAKLNNIKLIIAGEDKKYKKKLQQFVNENNLEEKVLFPGYMDREKIPNLMKRAKIFVFPSIYEGFGLPPLEAMACGTPVITSNVTSLPEVVGDAALLVNPYNTKEIAEGIIKLIEDENLRKELIQKGKERAKKFSWQKCAKQILNIYDEIKNECVDAKSTI